MVNKKGGENHIWVFAYNSGLYMSRPRSCTPAAISGVNWWPQLKGSKSSCGKETVAG